MRFMIQEHYHILSSLASKISAFTEEILFFQLSKLGKGV